MINAEVAHAVIHHAAIDDTTDEAWHETMAVNINGLFYVCRAAVKAMRPQGLIALHYQ